MVEKIEITRDDFRSAVFSAAKKFDEAGDKPTDMTRMVQFLQNTLIGALIEGELFDKEDN